MICPMILRNVRNHSPPTTQRSTINTRFLSNTCGKNPKSCATTYWAIWVQLFGIVNMSYIGWSELYSTVFSLFYCLSSVRLTLFPTPAVVTSMLSLFFSSSLRATAKIITYIQNNISESLYNNQHKCSEFRILLARWRFFFARTWDIKGVLWVTLPIFFRRFRKTLLYLQPTSSSKWKWGAKKIVQIVQCTFHAT